LLDYLTQNVAFWVVYISVAFWVVTLIKSIVEGLPYQYNIGF